MKRLLSLYTIVLLVILAAVVIIGCRQETPSIMPTPKSTQPSAPVIIAPTPPSAPVNLKANAVSQDTVSIRWLDNSNDEDGFRVYRDGILIANIDADVDSYQDKDLEPATHYQYTVIAYNEVGESQPCSSTVKTLNPAIMIRLDRIGVYDNREDWLRGKGDVYVLIGLVDGQNSRKLKFPSGQDQTYSLDKNETVSIGTIVYSTTEVTDNLQIMFVGYESDGGPFEQLAYEALGIAIDMYVTGGQATELAPAFNTSLGTIIGTLLGTEDDFLGQYELKCNKNNNWGIGQYVDIVLQDEGGVDCLRLWFTIESPGEQGYE